MGRLKRMKRRPPRFGRASPLHSLRRVPLSSETTACGTGTGSRLFSKTSPLLLRMGRKLALSAAPVRERALSSFQFSVSLKVLRGQFSWMELTYPPWDYGTFVHPCV